MTVLVGVLSAALARVGDWLVVLQTMPDLWATWQGKLLVALVVAAFVVFLGRFVLGVAWKLLRIAIVVVGVLWLLSVAAPALLG